MNPDRFEGSAVEAVRSHLAQAIGSGELQPGQKLEPERTLAEQLGVSRPTLRKALRQLEEDGFVRRFPGRGGGTFVTASVIERDLSKIVGVPTLLRQQGFTAGTQVVSASVVAGTAETCRLLDISEGSHVVDVVRIRLADGSPISLEHANFPAERFPGLLGLPLGNSLYEILQSEYGVSPGEALEQIEVRGAVGEEGTVLGVPAGSPLISIHRVTVDLDGRPFESSHDLFRSDRIRIHVRVSGDVSGQLDAFVNGRSVQVRS